MQSSFHTTDFSLPSNCRATQEGRATFTPPAPNVFQQHLSIAAWEASKTQMRARGYWRTK